MSKELRGYGRIYQRGKTFWIQYSVRGELHRESSRSSERKDAVRLLKQRVGESISGKVSGLSVEKISLADLIEALRADYEAKENRSVATIDRIERHLVGYFGASARAISITRAKLQLYVKTRQASRIKRKGVMVAPSGSSINNELRLLRHGFNLLVQDRRLSHDHVPKMPMVAEAGPRQGFVDDDQFEQLRDALPDYLRDPIAFLYFSGWRKSALKHLEWDRDVELVRDARGEITGGKVYLQAAFAKNKTTWELPIAGAIAEVIRRAWAARKPECALVFHRDGAPIGDFRKAWRKSVRAAKLGTMSVDARGNLAEHPLLIHDLRRSCVRNLVRAGVRESIAMQITQHKTRSVFLRYDITDGADREDAMAKQAASFARNAAARRVKDSST